MEPTQNISLRVPVALLAQLDVAAHEENRTRTQEIVLRLRRSFAKPDAERRGVAKSGATVKS